MGRDHFPGVLGTEGASQESQNIVFFFVSPLFFCFLEFFFGFLLGAFFKVSFFSPVLLGGFLNVFLVLSSGPSPKSYFFFPFLLGLSGFSNFLLVFVFSFFFLFFKHNVSFFCWVFQLY